MSLPPDVYDLPPELSCKPQPLIGLTGLDTLNNAVHRAIWDAFTSNRRPDKASVQYKLLGADHEFPPAKSKRNSYEWYIPKGILKRNWMDKYVIQVPSVVVIFYDLDWDDAFWNEKRLECASRVQSVRASLEGRTTKVAVVLVQHMPTLPAGEDAVTAERAASLCSTCELNAKSLFLLPHSDHLQGYTLRLENAFRDLAQTFYHQKIRSIRAHRDHLNKTTHQYLFVRHQFKMAFLSELKQDHSVAIKHYTQAYSHLLDLRLVDTNAMEIKTVAGFFSYKLCRIAFSLNLPRDAITQFRKHIELFRPISGSKELAFEHHAWLAKQYCIFGELFDEAIHQGLPAVQTQHPGIYFQQAAQHASDRKRSSSELCRDVTVYPHPDPLDGAEDLEFYGQRPWRPGKLSAEPADQMKEKEAIQALQYKEKNTVNHSMLIIALLGSAISQAKTYRCPRTRRQLVVQMAEEYYSAKDYSKALTLLSHMLWEYRSERWSLLLTNVLLRALDCAFLSASVQEFVALSIEAQGSHVTLAHEQKSAILENISRVLKKNAPTPPESVESDQNYAHTWKVALTAPSLMRPLSVDMNNSTAFLEAKACFCESSFEADKELRVEVLVRSRCLEIVQLCRVAVVVSNPSTSAELEAKGTGSNAENLKVLKHGEVKKFHCSFKSTLQDVGKEVQISSVLLYFGPDSNHCVLLRFSGSNSELAVASVCPELQHFRPAPHAMPDFDGMTAKSTATIVPRQARLAIELQHEAPALQGEWFPIQIELLNSEPSLASSVSVEVSLQPPAGDLNAVDQATHLSVDPSQGPGQLPLQLQVSDLASGERWKRTCYLNSYRVGPRLICFKVSYSVDKNALCECDTTLQVEVVKPFDATAKFCSLKFEPITKAFSQEPFVVMPELKCTSPWPLFIKTTSLDLSPQVTPLDKEISSQLAECCLSAEEIGTEAFCVSLSETSDQPVTVGMYTVQWQRRDSSSVRPPITSSSITLPALLKVEPAPLFVELELPAHGWVGSPMSAWYRVHNRTSKLLEVELSLQASDAFMFAGHKQLRLRLLPDAVHTLSYNLYPLLSGLVALPQLKLSPTEGSTDLRATQLVELLERSLPTHIYVMPQAKGNPDLRKTMS